MLSMSGCLIKRSYCASFCKIKTNHVDFRTTLVCDGHVFMTPPPSLFNNNDAAPNHSTKQPLYKGTEEKLLPIFLISTYKNTQQIIDMKSDKTTTKNF